MQDSAGFPFGPNKNLILRFGDATLRAGAAAHRLDIEIKTYATWVPDTTNANDLANIVVQGFAQLDNPASQPLGVIAPQGFWVRGYEVNERLPIHLTDEQLVAIEARRGLHNIQLLLDLQAILLGETGPILLASAQVRYSIEPARWIALLDAAGLGVGITIRVPTPLADPGSQQVDPLHPLNAGFAQAGMRLREARQALRDRPPEHAVQACRKVLEIIRELTPPPTQAEVKAVAAKDRDARLRWGAMFWDLYGLASAASHEDALTRTFTWTRPDADAVLAATAGLLARAMSSR